MDLTPETQEELRKGQDYKRLVSGPEWERAKAELLKLLDQNASIFSIDAKDANQMYQEIAARQLAVTMVKDWLNLIEGSAMAHELNEKAMKTMEDSETVLRF